MNAALTGNAYFTENLISERRMGCPWNIVLWNFKHLLSRKRQTANDEKLYKQALGITKEHPENATIIHLRSA